MQRCLLLSVYSSSKIGSFEKSCVTQCLSVSIPLIVTQLKAGRYYQVLPVLVLVFNKKKTFYKDLRTSAMIGSYWNKAPGAPEARAQCIAAFCEQQGFHLLLSTLEQMMTSSTEIENLEAAMDSDDIRILLQAMLEFRASVPDVICAKICVLIMTYFTKISDSVMKKEPSDAIGAVLAIIRRLVDSGVVSGDSINELWLEITQRYVESTSLPLRLFGLEQINQIVNCARASRSFPPRYLVRNAGTSNVNGVYTLKPDSTTATYVFRRAETNQVFTLFCCTMKSGLKWWFISEADKVQPGSDQDIDYYQHQSQYEEYLPPTNNWVPTGKGESPAPELIPETIEENGTQDCTRLDYILSAWVLKKKVIEEIFGDRIHREIVSRSALLVKFLAEEGKLEKNGMEAIWRSTIQQDQTLVDEIHSLLIATVPFLSQELLLHLIETIHDSLREKIRLNEPFPELISFLHRLATNVSSFLMERTQNVTTAILQLLWSIQMHYSHANMRLSRNLREFFQEGLRSEFGDPLRKVFLDECIDGIKRSCFASSVVTSPKSGSTDDTVMSSPGAPSESMETNRAASKSLELLKFLIDSYRMDQAFIVESLNAEHGLVTLLFDELAAFVSRCSDKLSASYRTAIGHRLELIHFVHVKSSKLELSIPQIERLWNVLSSSSIEREFCLIFFNQTSVRNPVQQTGVSLGQSMGSAVGAISPAFSVEVCSYIFNELLCQQTDFHTMGCMGYKCFHTYFVVLNAQFKSQVQSGELKQETKMNALNILGLDALWRIVFDAPMDVSELATRELLRTYEKFAEEHDELDSEVDISVKDFLQRVFFQLSQVEDAQPEKLKLVQQSTSLLNGLAVNSRKKQSFVAHGLSGRGAYYSVKVMTQRIPASSQSGGNAVGSGASNGNVSPVVANQANTVHTMQITVYANQTLWLFRKQLEKLTGHSMQQTKILCGGSAITGDMKTLSELHLTESSDLRVLLFNWIVDRGSIAPDQDHNMTSDSDIGLQRQHPAQIIARETSYFDIIFRVLDIVTGHPVHASLWEFVNKIPTSVELAERVATIGNDASVDTDVDMITSENSGESRASKGGWSSLLQNVSPHRAIYTLQIMDALLLPSDMTKSVFAQAYLRRFVNGGGLHEVLSYLLETHFHESSFNEGAAAALRILKFCLFDSERGDSYLAMATGEGEDVDYDIILAKNDEETSLFQSNLMAEQANYDRLILKIAELVVSEHNRGSTITDSKAAPRILIDAIKSVESIVAVSSDAADKYLSYPVLRSIVADVLMNNDSDQVREQWLSSLQSICKASATATSSIFEQFIQSLNDIEDISVPCDQYSRMLRYLAQAEGFSAYCKTLVQHVVSKLRLGFSTKFMSSSERSVEVIIAFLELLRDVLITHADVRDEMATEIVDVVYEECLFTLPSEDRKRCPLCVSLEARRPAFKLLATAISSNSSILHDLQIRLSRLFTRSDEFQHKWGQENNVETRGIGEYVGLKNQGCSCYMNSFLQQIFMHPTLRQGILAAKVPPRSIPREPTKAEVEQAPERLIGCRIALECIGNRLYEATVVAYDDLTGRHTLRYEDGGEASFVLTEGRPGNENGRYAILPMELTGKEGTMEVLRQVQRTFCHLRDSEMRYFNPKELLESCKVLNLEFSVYQQNDASEFCDKLLEHLEIALKNTPQGLKCLQNAFGGKCITQKIPKDCGHRVEKAEPFILLNLQIRGKESVEESLASYVQGEVMDGDNKVECEMCETKKAAIRRTCIGPLPNMLILHLKRFDFDYTICETVKLNNRCSFPMNLNVKPYTKTGIEEQEASIPTAEDVSGQDEEASTSQNVRMSEDFANDTTTSPPSSNRRGSRSSVADVKGISSQMDPNFEYRLKGILVHSGVAQGGHYYSFIYDNVQEKWFKFDDEDVSPFDPANIEAECFGGVQRRSWHGTNNSMDMEVFSNALMLFYEKIVPAVPEQNDTDESPSAIATDSVECEQSPNEYEPEVWKSNEVFLQNSYLFDVEFHEFLREMVQSKYIKDPVQQQLVSSPTKSSGSIVSPPPAPASATVSEVSTSADEEIHATLAEIGVEFVLSVLSHSREKHGIARWINVLAAKFARQKTICTRFFNLLSTTKRIPWLRGLLFECPDSIARQSFVHLVSRALTAFEAHMKISREESDVIALQEFLSALAGFLNQTSVMQQTHLEECFMLIRNCAEISPTARDILRSQDMIARLINFFLGDRSPNPIKEAFSSSRIAPTTNRYASPDYQYLLEAMVTVLGLPRRTTEPLLTESNAMYPHRVILSDKAEAALTEIFNDYQIDGGYMGTEEVKNYLRKSVHGSSNISTVEQSARVLLSKYGNNDTPQRIELDGFLMYYTDIAAQSTKNVIQDLRAFGFGDDLKRQPRTLPLSSTILEGLSELSRMAITSEVFIDSVLEEDAETVSDLLLRISAGDRATSTKLLRSLLHCMNSIETGWKGQPVVDACTNMLQSLLSYDYDYQQELVTIALVNPEFGLIITAENREKVRQRYVNNNHISLFVYRQIATILELQLKVALVREWLETHRSDWEWMYEWLRLESLKPSLGGRPAVLYREPAKLDTLRRLGEVLQIPFQEEEHSYVVEGAGFDDVNGIYKSTSLVHDNCLTYTCVKGEIEYTLFRCCMPSDARRWYISFSPNKSLLGTMSDVDYYFVQCRLEDEVPPEEGWKLWPKNPKAAAPAPSVRLHRSTVALLPVSEVGLSQNEFADIDADGELDAADVDGDVDADTVEYDDSEDEIRVSNERFQAVHLDNQDDGERSSGTDDFM